MRRSVSSPDETPRRELKIRHTAEYFWRTSRCLIWWWNTLLNAWYCFSNTMILEWEIKDTNISSYLSDFQTLINLQFPLYFCMNYLTSLRSAIKSFSFILLLTIRHSTRPKGTSGPAWKMNGRRRKRKSWIHFWEQGRNH